MNDNNQKVNRPRRLIVQISFVIITITTTLLLVFGSYRHFTSKKSLISRIEKRSERLVKRLSGSINTPYYNLDESSVINTILSEMDDPSVSGVYLYEHFKDSLEMQLEMGFVRDKNGKIKKTEKVQDDLRLIRRKSKIVFGDEVLGEIYVYITTQYMEEQLKEGLLADIIQIVVLDIFLMVLFIVLLRIQFVRPIQSLTEAASDIAKGDLSKVIDVRSNNEIGRLADAFRNMIVQLRQTLNELEKEISEKKLAEKELALHRDHLEDIVKERTSELSVANTALRNAEEKSRSLLENSPDFILNVNPDLKVQYINKPMHGMSVDNIIGTSVFDFILHNEELKTKVLNIFETGRSEMFENMIELPDGQNHWYENRVSPIANDDNSISIVMFIVTDITKRKKAEIELKLAQKELIDRAHKAGMADIATGTLHNVGNILTSVLTSAQIMEEILANSRITDFIKANQILRDNIDNIENFVIENPKGKKLMQYYLVLENKMTEENYTINQHLERLNTKANAITEVIAAQQSYATADSLADAFRLEDIIEDSLTMQYEFIKSYNITIVKNFIDLPPVIIQKTKLVHIMINLIKNAKDAMLSTPPEDRFLRLKMERTEEAAFLKISDSGEGISPEKIQKIFAHGFTTKSNGHGFGLHSSANYMTEMGCRMWAESDGPGKGATFILRFPFVKNS